MNPLLKHTLDELNKPYAYPAYIIGMSFISLLEQAKNNPNLNFNGGDAIDENTAKYIQEKSIFVDLLLNLERPIEISERQPITKIPEGLFDNMPVITEMDNSFRPENSTDINNLNLTKMEKNTVFVDLTEYNELRDFQKEIRSGKVFSFFRSWHSGETQFFFTEDEVVKEFEAKNRELEAEKKELNIKNKELEAKIEKYDVKELKGISIKDIKKMSYWEFRKWRKS